MKKKKIAIFIWLNKRPGTCSRCGGRVPSHRKGLGFPWVLSNSGEEMEGLPLKGVKQQVAALNRSLAVWRCLNVSIITPQYACSLSITSHFAPWFLIFTHEASCLQQLRLYLSLPIKRLSHPSPQMRGPLTLLQAPKIEFSHTCPPTSPFYG